MGGYKKGGEIWPFERQLKREMIQVGSLEMNRDGSLCGTELHLLGLPTCPLPKQTKPQKPKVHVVA